VSVDLVCVGRPFLDLALLGLPNLPEPGSEVYARDLQVAPGGIALVALAARRLGATVAIASPVATDWAGGLLRELLAAEGIAWEGPPDTRAAVTVAMGMEQDRAMATFGEPAPPALEDALALRPRTLVVDLEHVSAVGGELPVHSVLDEAEARRFAGGLPAGARQLRTLFANEREACTLTGERDPRDAARELAAEVPTVVVTLGAEGALAAAGDVLLHEPAPRSRVASTLGAGDLLAGAFVAHDLEGAPLAERAGAAVTYASLAVRAPTAPEGAVNRAALEEALRRPGGEPCPVTNMGEEEVA
jgi:sugar/nucleoside kinase (ribokinase family)